MINIKSIGDSHFDDCPDEKEDHELGEQLAHVIGTTFIDLSYTGVEEWTTIVKALRIHGLKIVERGEDK